MDEQGLVSRSRRKKLLSDGEGEDEGSDSIQCPLKVQTFKETIKWLEDIQQFLEIQR